MFNALPPNSFYFIFHKRNCESISERYLGSLAFSKELYSLQDATALALNALPIEIQLAFNAGEVEMIIRTIPDHSITLTA